MQLPLSPDELAALRLAALLAATNPAAFARAAVMRAVQDALDEPAIVPLPITELRNSVIPLHQSTEGLRIFPGND